MPTKKAAPTAPKKVAVPKKTAAPATTQSLVYASDGESFWTSDGQILNSLTALRDALKSMEKSVFAHHVTKEKNDFAAWVDAVLGDALCAMDLRKSKTPASAHTVVVAHLKRYRV